MDELSPVALRDHLVDRGLDEAAANLLREPDWVCHRCRSVISGGMNGFQHHMKRKDHVPPFICGQGICIRDYNFRKSLYDHLKSYHMNDPAPMVGAAPNQPLPPPQPQPLPPEVWYAAEEDLDSSDVEYSDRESEAAQEVGRVNPDFQTSLEREAALSTLKLRGINYMTTVAVQAVQEQCNGLIQYVASHLKDNVRTFLSRETHSLEDIEKLLAEFTLSDPFIPINTKTKQLNIFKRIFGLLEAEEIPLNRTFQSRQHPQRPMLVPTQVGKSFQYLSIIKILKCVMRDDHLRNLILSAKKSEDGFMRSFLDGKFYESLPAHLKHPAVIFIVLYVDDLELLNGLSARAGNWTMAGIYFGILNFPAKLNALLTYIFVTALAFAEDAKHSQVWEPLVKDLKTLETEGAEISLDGRPFHFKAVLVAQIGDCKAAHELLGFAPASSHAFCRACYILRPDMWKDGLMIGELRTPERHIEDVQGCKNTVIRKVTGVAGPPLINGLSFFEPTQNSIFDIFHDFQQGICKMEVKLALRDYVCIKKYFTEEQLVSRLKFFDYGLPDAKNKPSPRMTAEYLRSLKSYNLHQTGSQMWLFTRAFPFLFGDLVPKDDKFMKLISLLNQIMVIVYSPTTCDDYIDNLGSLIFEHHTLFQEMFPGQPEPEQDGEAAEANTEEDVDDPEEIFSQEEGGLEDVLPADTINHEVFSLQVVEESDNEGAEEVEATAEAPSGAQQKNKKAKKKRPRIVRFINKHHHLLHYLIQLRLFGPLVLYWSMRYEAKHHFFKLVATVCNNFINILKTLMEMLQMKTCSDWQQPRSILLMGKRGTKLFSVCDTEHSKELIDYGFEPTARVYHVNHVTFHGVDYRPELFVTLKLQSRWSLPTFAVIKAIYVNYEEDDVHLIIQVWQTVRFDSLYCAFEVEPTLNDQLIQVHRAGDFPSYRLLAIWRKYDSDKAYLCPRTIA